MDSEWVGFFDTPRSLDVFRLRKRGTGRVRLETFAILDHPPEAAILEWASGWPEPHGSDVVGGPQHVVLEDGWREFIGYRAEINDVDAEPRKLWRVDPGPPYVRVVDPDEALSVPRFREVSARLAVDPSRDDVDSVAERLASLLSADEIANYWARLQLELGEVPGLVSDVVSRSRDSEQYLLMEDILAGDRPIPESNWGERFLDVADQAASLVEGIPVVYSFESDHTGPDVSPVRDYLSLVMGYFRGRRPGTRAGEEFFYVFSTNYYSGGGHLYPRDLSRAQAEKVLAPFGLELAGEPEFQEYAMTNMISGPTVELTY